MATNTNKPILSVTPTFLLRKIDPHQIYEQYIQGQYANIKLPPEKITISTTPIVVQPTVGNSPESDVYTYRTKSNTIQTVVTTNHTRYQICTTSGAETPDGGECDWCWKEFKHKAVGIPVQVDYIRDNGETITKYYVDGCMCSFECTLAELKKHYALSYRYRDPLYIDSEQLLRNLYSTMYPNAGFLRPAPDFHLLRRRGGSLNYDEFHDKKHTYERTPNVVVAPLKVQYLKQSY